MPNLAPDLLERLAASGITLTPEAIFHYVYAVTNAPEYRRRFADALRYDFARIPLTRDPRLFESIRDLGADLTAIHLLEHPDVPLAAPPLDGNDQAVVRSPSYDENRAEIKIADDLVAKNITPSVWRYQQGAYPVVRNYLQAREGRSLSADEFEEFRRLVGAVRLTLDRLGPIDESIGELTSTAFELNELLAATT